MLGKTFIFPHFYLIIFRLSGFALNIFILRTLVLFSIIVCLTLFSFQGTTFNIECSSLRFSLIDDGGDEEDRTPDPLLARQVLSQLSYTPVF